MPGSERSGYYVAQPTGFAAYIPRPLPPAPTIELSQLVSALCAADQAIGRLDGATVNDLALLDHLFSQPLVNAKWVGETLGVTPITANVILTRFTKFGFLREITGNARNRVFRYDEYLAAFDQPEFDLEFDETNSAAE